MKKQKEIPNDNGDVRKTLEENHQRLRESLEEMKMDAARELLDRGEYEKGLALYDSVSGVKHREWKCDGMARALIEMKRYGEARVILEKGLKELNK